MLVDVLTGRDVTDGQADRLTVLAYLSPGGQVDQRKLVPAWHRLPDHDERAITGIERDPRLEVDACQAHRIGRIQPYDGLFERRRQPQEG